MESFQLKDKKGNIHEFVIKLHEHLQMHFYYLDRRRIVVDDRYGYLYSDTERPISKYLADQVDKVLGLPETGTDKEEE